MANVESQELKVARERSKKLYETRNDGAYLVQDELGLNFGESLPRKIPLTTNNLLSILSISEKGCSGKIGVVREILIYLNAGGLYDASMDSYLVKDEKRDGMRGTEIHENIHGWQARVRPDLFGKFSDQEHNKIQNWIRGYTDTEEAKHICQAEVVRWAIKEGTAGYGQFCLAAGSIHGENSGTEWNTRNFMMGTGLSVAEDYRRDMLLKKLDRYLDLENELTRLESGGQVEKAAKKLSWFNSFMMDNPQLYCGLVGYYYFEAIMRERNLNYANPKEVGLLIKNMILDKPPSYEEIVVEVKKLLSEM